MPVEIKELIIRAVAEKDEGIGEIEPDSWTGDDEREAIVQACVRQVLRILNRSRER